MQLSLTLANDQALKRLANAGPVFEEAASAFLTKAGLMMEGKARETAPSDESTLRNSITSSQVKKRMGELFIEVGTNVEYAPYQEFGTGLYGPSKSPIVPKRAKMLAFRARSGQMVFAKQVSGVRPKKFMEAGAKAVQDNPDIAFAEADKVIKEKL